MQNSIQQNILERLGLGELPQESQVELLTRMTESVLKRITLEVLQSLSEADQDVLLKMQEEQETFDPEKIEQFLREKVPQYEQLVQKVVEQFTTEMEETVAILKEATV